MSQKILEALHAVMSEVGYIQKTGVNDFHKYSYASEADALAVLRPAMLKHGLILIPSANMPTEVDVHGNTFVRVEYTLAHKDGDVWPEKIAAVGAGNDRNRQGGVGDKGVYKALTGANKYLLFKLFQMETGDDPEIVSEADQSPPRDPSQAAADSGPVEDPRPDRPTPSEIYGRLITRMRQYKNREALTRWKDRSEVQEAIESLDQPDFFSFNTLYRERYEALP